MGTPQNFYLTFIDELEKQLFIKKNCWSEPIKNVKILILTMLYFSKKLKKTPADIIILQLCTKSLEDMIYSSWDIECDRLKLVIMGHFFCPFTSPLKTQKIKILKKWKNLLEISSFYRCVPKTTIIWVTVPEIWSDTDGIFCNFGLFLPFYPSLPPPAPLTTQKI